MSWWCLRYRDWILGFLLVCNHLEVLLASYESLVATHGDSIRVFECCAEAQTANDSDYLGVRLRGVECDLMDSKARPSQLTEREYLAPVVQFDLLKWRR